MTNGADVQVVRDFRRALRRKRLTNVHWVDAIYRVYVTALIGGVAVLYIGDSIGDAPVRGDALETVTQRGPAWVGIAAAAAIAIGLRSGSRGGPLALERTDIRHLLLAPVDRGAALRGPALHQLRFALFVAAVVGAAAGELASHRLPGEQPAWIASGAVFGLTTAALGYGIAFLASGLRLRPWIATGLAIIVLGWSVADAADVLPSRFPASPTRWIGDIGLWPFDFQPIELLALVGAAGLLAVGILRVGNVSLESAERRSTLVGQLRFAATLQDVRTVIVLRRQLALEMPRVRPWIRVKARPRDRLPVWTRGWRGVLRWPAPRIGRLILAAIVAGLCMRAVWDGTTPLIVVAGLALYIAGLEAVEPLAQEIDHPSRRDAVPVDSGPLHLRHVPVAVAVLLPVGTVAGAAAVLVDPSTVAVEVAAVALIPAALGAAASGLVSTIKGAPDPNEDQALLPPEAAGPRLAFRTAFPPALAVFGLLPVLLGRFATDNGRSPVEGTAEAVFLVVAVFALVCAWVRYREEMRRSLQEQMRSQSRAREAGGG
ncbi:MAG: hypothetical protein ACRD0A_05585 [Acidimicrobiales bacterium]